MGGQGPSKAQGPKQLPCWNWPKVSLPEGKRQEHSRVLRGEGVVLFLTPYPLAIVGFLRGTGLVIEIKLVESIGESQQHQAVNKEELEDVEQHAAQRNLQRSQVRVCCKQGDETQGA